mmetsp:Transcript_1873/g.1982  ORF Transcript_1873/g.1982 Transcript_1873/m.1982 type:complete len:456 (-) Transcript_1873:36-1403(-)
MIQSLFLLSPTGEILIERHFRGQTSRSICQKYWEKASVGSGLASAEVLSDTMSPVLELTNVNDHGAGGSGSIQTIYLFSILRDGLSYLAACPSEVSPLLVIEFLHRVADTFGDYFGSPTDEDAIKENFSTVYQLLEEMVDFGWPLTTEPNALQDLIRLPTVLSKIQQVVTGGTNAAISEVLPSGTVSNMPWRKAGCKYSQNEIYFDMVEEIDALIDVSGRVISSDVSGSIQAQAHLSGVPDILLTFSDPDVIDDCAFHPCVRYGKFELDKVVSFVPPDGAFTLMTYRLKADQSRSISPPLNCMPQFSYGTGNNSSQGRVVVSIGVKPVSSIIRKGMTVKVEEITVTIPFPKIVRTANLTATVGTVLYDEAAKIASWRIGKVNEHSRPMLTGTFLISGTDKPEENPPLGLSWKIPQSSVSGLTVSGLTLTGVNYGNKPYKGVRSLTKSGRFQVRCN